MSQEEKQKKNKKIQKIKSEKLNQKLSLLEKLLIIAGCLQIINEGIDELKGLSVFKQDFKRKMNNFSNFVERSSDDLVNEIYTLDEEYAQYLTQGIENYTKSLVGFINVDPAELIGRYSDAD